LARKKKSSIWASSFIFLKRGEMMGLTLGNLVYFIKAKNDDFTRTMRDTESKLKNTKNEFEKTSQKITQVGAAFTAAGAVIIGTIIGLTSKSKELNAELANIGTLIPGNIKRLNELKKEIRNIAVETGKSTKDLAAGTYQLISALGDAADTSEKLEINAKAAAAGLAETKDAINLTSAVIKAYGDTTAKATQKAADLAFITVKLGQTTFPELAASIGRVTPLAAQLNVTQEEMFSLFATLTGVTGDTAEVSTQAAAIMRGFIKPTKDMSKAIKDLEYDSASALLADKGLVGALKAVMSKTDGTEESVAKLFRRAEALVAVFSLAGSSSETFERKLNELQKAAGATETAFKEQTEGINKAGFKWQQTMVRIEVAVQRLGDVAAPAFAVIAGSVETLVKWLEKLTDEVEQLPKPVQKIIGVLTALSGILLTLTGPVLLLIGWLPQIISGMKTLKMVIPAIVAGMKGLSASFAPFLIGAAVLAGIIALINKFRNASKDAVKNYEKLLAAQESKKNVESLAQAYEKLIKKIKEAKPNSKEWKDLKTQQQDLMNQIARNYPSVVTAYDAMGNARKIDIRLLNKQIELEGKLDEKRLSNARKQAKEGAKDILNKAKAQLAFYQKQLDDLQNKGEAQYVKETAGALMQASLRTGSALTSEQAEAKARENYNKGRLKLAQEIKNATKEVEEAQAQYDKVMGKKTKPSPGPEGDNFACPYCGKKFKTQVELDKHMKTCSKRPKGSGADERTAYEKAKDKFETFAAAGTSAESQLAKWRELTKEMELAGEELDDYNKKTAELKKAADDAIRKAQNELALTKITDAQENELKQLELSYKEQTKGMRDNDKQKIALTEKYNIERQRITEKWGKEKSALEKENEAIDARARGDYEAAALADEEARYTREINNLSLTAEQKEKIEKEHEQEVVDIKKQCAGEREALLKESQAIELRLKGEYENADIAEEDARWAREKSSLIEGTTEYQNALKQHEEKVKQIKRDYTEDWAAANLEFKKGELDLRIQGLETEKQMAELGPNKYIAKRNILELEKQIVGLKLEQLDLDIKDLERQRDKAIELKDQLKAKQLQNQIDQAKLSKKSLQSDLDYDIASYNFDRSMYTEVHDSLESAIRDGFEDGKNIASSFADYLGDVLKQKVYKAMADAMLNSSAGQSLTGSIGSIVAGIFGGGKTPTQTPVGTNSESGAINPGNGGLLGSIFSKGKGSLIDNFKSLFSGGGTKAFGALLPQLGMLGLGANLLGGLFGGGSDTAMNISANTAKMDIDFATANFKTVTLPKTYMSSQSGTTRNANSVAPVVNVNINAAGNIITERDLQKTMKETANEVYSARKVAGEKWSEATVNGVDINDY
jgi:TP901 family phage tail tape measure protein